MLLGAACDTNEQPGQPPAPLGEITALERLADGYQAVTDTLAANPVTLPPDQRRLFIKNVFLQSGYDYTATLTAVANGPLNLADKNQHDLVELLLYPTVGLSDGDITELYSSAEASALIKLKQQQR